MLDTKRPTIASGVLIAVATAVLCLARTIARHTDLDVYLEAGQRLLAGGDIYTGSSIASGRGFLGPPAQALLFIPLAAADGMSRSASRILWSVLNSGLLVYALSTWTAVFTHADASPWRTPVARLHLMSSRECALALLAVAHPLLVQLEHQNLNIVLLALTAYAACAIARDRWSAAGVAIGIAAAVKVYPAVLLVWLALRGRGRAVAAGMAIVLVLSLAPIAFVGWHEAGRQATRWLTLAREGWPLRRANQSLTAMWGRATVAEPPDGYGILAGQRALPLGLAIVSSLFVIVPLLVAARRAPATPSALVEELACVSALGVLLSPIAWEHYALGFFPVAVMARSHRQDERWRLATAAFWIAVICITVLSRPVVGWHAARMVRALSLKTVGGLALCVACAWQLATTRR